MNPLGRQPSRVSLLSWWSDSNPNLQSPATINLHTMAKPLARYLYHRSAMRIIKTYHGQTLTAEILELYASYLPWTFTSAATKAMIISEVILSLRCDESLAQALISSAIFPHLKHILESRDRSLQDPVLQKVTRILMQSLYDHQVSYVIERTTGLPLTTEILELYASCLSYRPVSAQAKTMIVSELRHQVKRDRSQVSTIFRHCMEQLLESQDDLMQNLALQAATSGLLRSLCAHQVSGLIEKKRGQPLTAELLEVYASCLTWTFVDAETKAMILSELRRQIERDGNQACIVFLQCKQSLQTLAESFVQDAHLRESVASLLRCLSVHKSSILLGANDSKQLEAEIRWLYEAWEDTYQGYMIYGSSEDNLRAKPKYLSLSPRLLGENPYYPQSPKECVDTL
ncbi:hypothetical protein R3P38DRAFT_1836031 [Favolaschia claudopus]|uniref:Uncharacterized protein n=1 Tax=Favolaschia claudopus TaxID=2862362 RepID=A0AAW0A366_9AGAR